jgi:hypothetical protein
MFMQIFATLFIGGFITLAVIGHVALFHALFFRPAEPAPQPQTAERKLRLVVPEQSVQFARDRQLARKAAEPVLRIA